MDVLTADQEQARLARARREKERETDALDRRVQINRIDLEIAHLKSEIAVRELTRQKFVLDAALAEQGYQKMA
jgi:hypothetical protein